MYFVDNIAPFGAGLYLRANNSLLLNGSTFSSNLVTKILNMESSTLLALFAVDSVMYSADNTAQRKGGLYFEKNNRFTMFGSTLSSKAFPKS